MSSTDNLNNDAENQLKENPQGETPFEQGQKPGDILDIGHEEISSQVKIFANAKDDAKQIFAALFPNSDYKKHLKSLQKKYGSIEINSADDTEAYKLVKSGLSEVRPFRTSVTKKTDIILAEAKKYIKDVNEMKGEFVAEIGKIENPLKEKREKFEQLEIDRENEEKERIAQKKNERLGLLSKNGMTFDGNFWSINDISVGVLEIEKYDDEVFETILGKVIAQNKINLDKEAEEKETQRLTDLKNKEKEEKEKLQQERFDKIKMHLAFIREDVSKCSDWSQEKFDQVYSDAVEAKKLQDQEDEDRRIQIRELRTEQLESLGIEVTSDHYKLINESSREDWNIIMDGYKKAKKDKEENEAKEKRERETLATNSVQFKALGYIYNYNTGDWEITVGLHSHAISKVDMLELREGFYDEIKTMVEKWQKEWLKVQEDQRLNEQFGVRRLQLAGLGFTISVDKFVCANIQREISSIDVRNFDDEKYNEFISEASLKLKEFKDAELKREEEIAEQERQSRLGDIEKYNEWIVKLQSIEAPVVTNIKLSRFIAQIKDLLQTVEAK